ncbi:TetR/AcrR family transcriptional regulator [Paenibacillus sp. GCM10027627]
MPKRKPGRPKASGTPQTMGHILRTASFLFMEHGFEKVSLEGVAHACGVTKASVYYYFPNKAVLFTEAISFVLNIARKQTASLLGEAGPLQTRLLLVAQRHMQNAHVDFETMMREAATGLSEEQINRIREAEQAIHAVLTDVFRLAMEKGEISTCDPFLLSHVFIAMLSVRNRRHIVNDSKSMEQTAEDIVQLLWKGLSPRTP